MKTVNTVSYVLVAIILIGSLLLDAKTSVLVAEALCSGAYFIALAIFSSIAQKKCLERAKEILENDCNPIEICEITSAIYKENSKSSANIINYCYALFVFDEGSYENVGVALEQIKSTHMAITSKYEEALFYSLLCSINLHFGELATAEESYKRGYEAYNGITKEGQSKEIQFLLLINIVNLLIVKGDIDRARSELYSIDESTRRGRVEKLFLQAKIDLVEGKKDEAREKLQRVVSLGGGLAITKEADELLENE